MKKETKYTIRDMAGSVIESGLTLVMAETLLSQFEATDKAEGCYTVDKYVIVPTKPN